MQTNKHKEFLESIRLTPEEMPKPAPKKRKHRSSGAEMIDIQKELEECFNELFGTDWED